MRFDRARFERFVQEKMSKTRLPGLSVALVAGGKVVYARGFGFRDVESGLPATPDTLYCVGSVTKSFTALAVMQLAERGLLSLDDPVERYAPLRLSPFGEPVRIRHLLTHTSGVPALGYAEALIRSVIGDDSAWMPIASYEDMFSFLSGAEEWAEARPGERFFYLNEGYVLLGYVIEKLSGERYEDYVKHHILEPLGMRRSCFGRRDFEERQDRAVPYVLTRDGERVRSTYPFGIAADGGLISSVTELANYIRMYLGRGELDGFRLVSPETVEEMERPRVPVPFELVGGEAYGYGWIITPDFLGHKLVWHSGSVLTSTAFVGYVPDAGLGVAVLANASGYPLSHVGTYALALALGRDPEEELPFIKFDAILDRLEGRYETYRGTMRVDVVRRGDMLFFEWKGRYTEYVVPFVPEVVEREEARFYTIRAGRKVEALFRVREEEVELLYERYKLKKTGPLPS